MAEGDETKAAPAKAAPAPAASVQPPPGAPEGGVWGTNTYVGSQTQLVGCLGCLLFGFPGLIICVCCPMDERDAYKVNNVVYDAGGDRLGEGVRFVPKANRMQR